MAVYSVVDLVESSAALKDDLMAVHSACNSVVNWVEMMVVDLASSMDDSKVA